MKIVAPLRLPAFRRLFTAQVVANTGDGLDFLAIITIVVFQWDRGAGAVGILALCSAVPMIIGAPLYGMVADRFEPRLVMCASNLARGAAIAALALSGDFAMICLLSGVAAFFGGFHSSAQQRFIRHRVPDDLLLSANSLRSTTERMLTGLAGPGIAAVTISVFGARETLFITAVSFVLAGLLVLSVGRLPDIEPKSKSGRPPLGARLAAGWSHINGNRQLRLLVLGMTTAYLLSMMFDIMLPVWYRDMGGGPAFMGVAMMCMGIGGAVGALGIAQYGNRIRLMSAMTGSSILIGLMVGLMGVAGLAGMRDLLGVWLACAAGVGVGASAAIVAYTTLVQRLTPKELMGRVAALTMGAALTAPTVVGPALAPPITAVVGVHGLFTFCGAALILIGVLFAWRGRHYDRPTPSTKPEQAGEDTESALPATEGAPR